MKKRILSMMALVMALLLALTPTVLAQTTAATPKITQARAEKIALEKTGGGQIVRIELENEDGVLVYDVDIVKGNQSYEVEINANTGEIIEFEKRSAK